MKTVVLDGYTLNPGDLSWHPLEELCQLTVYDRTAKTPSEKELIIKRIRDADAVYTNKTPLTAEIIEAVPNVKFIGVLATGYNIVDTDAARQKEILVTNIPTYGTTAVSQMAIALLLEICHHVGSHSDSVMNGEWQRNSDWCYWKHPLIELATKTMGIIGFGRIGQMTGKIAQALGMKILAFDSYPDKTLESTSMQYVDLDELFSKSDVISLHCPLFESTQGIINKNTIGKMKTGVIIINNSRGQLVVESDLATALNCGKVSAAALDVVSSEPIENDNPLLKAKNCIITPHISWASKEARQRLMDIAVENLRQFIAGTPINIVGK